MAWAAWILFERAHTIDGLAHLWFFYHGPVFIETLEHDIVRAGHETLVNLVVNKSLVVSELRVDLDGSIWTERWFEALLQLVHLRGIIQGRIQRVSGDHRIHYN